MITFQMPSCYALGMSNSILASSPPLFFVTRTQRDALTDVRKLEKEGLVHTAVVIVRMRVDFPRIWGVVISHNILAILYRILV